MDISTALWAAAIGVGSGLLTLTLLGSLLGRRMRSTARAGGFGGPPWAHGHPGMPRHAAFAGAAGHCGPRSGHCTGRHGHVAEQVDGQPPAQAEA